MGRALPASLHPIACALQVASYSLRQRVLHSGAHAPLPQGQRLLVFPVILVARLLSTSMLVPVDCVALSDAPRCFVCLWTPRYSLLVARTAFNNNHRLKNKFVTIDLPAMGVAMQSVLSQCFETHDGLREGLWRLLVAQSPFSRLALPHAILCYLSF